LDDGVAELAQHAGRLAETLHADAVRRVGVESRQHGVTDTGPEHDLLTKILGTMLTVRRQVHVETVDDAPVSAVLHTTGDILQHVQPTSVFLLLVVH